METPQGAAPGMNEPPHRDGVPQPAGQPRQPIYPTYPAYPPYPMPQGRRAYPPQYGQPVRPPYPQAYPGYPAYPAYPPQHTQQAHAHARPPVAKRATPAAPRMAKAQAQALAARVKKWTLGLSLAGFLTLGGLVATHNVVSASAQPAGNSDDGNSSINSGDDQSGTQSGSYFGQPGGSGFGSGGSSSPVSGSRSS